MRDLPITAVARQLDIALPARDGTRTVASSALTQARARLGAEPMEWLFLRSAEEWAHRSASADRWRGLALYGVDGTTLRVADSVENRAHFGSQNSGRHEGGRDERVSGYPLLRLVVVMALRSHLLAAATFGPFGIDERVYAASLWDTVPDHSLVLRDRNFRTEVVPGAAVEAPPDEAEVVVAEGRAFRSNAELAEAYAARFAAEPVDAAWAADAQRRYLPAIRGVLPASSQLVSFECRSQFCDVSVVHDSIETSNGFIPRGSAQNWPTPDGFTVQTSPGGRRAGG